MDKNFKISIYIATVLQLLRMFDAAITGSNVVYSTNSINQPNAGIAIDHPAQATIYAKRGKLNVLIPFEFTIIPLSQNSIEPEVAPRTNAPISGSISSQQNSNYYRTNHNTFRPVYYQPSSYPWNNNNYINNRGFYVPASPSVSSSYQPFVPPNQPYQSGNRPIVYQQQLPANTYRNQYYAPNNNVAYAPSYQQQQYRGTEIRPWPQYNRPAIQNQPQQQPQPQQQQQSTHPNQPNGPANSAKPINISEINSIHPPNATTTNPLQNNNQTHPVAGNSTSTTSVTTETKPIAKEQQSPTTTSVTTETKPIAKEQPAPSTSSVTTETKPIAKEQPAPSTSSVTTETKPIAKEQPAVPAQQPMSLPNPKNGNDNTQTENPKPIYREQIPAHQQGETILEKKNSLPVQESNAPQNNGQNNKIAKAENTNQQPAPFVNHERKDQVQMN